MPGRTSITSGCSPGETKPGEWGPRRDRGCRPGPALPDCHIPHSLSQSLYSPNMPNFNQFSALHDNSVYSDCFLFLPIVTWFVFRGVHFPHLFQKCPDLLLSLQNKTMKYDAFSPGSASSLPKMKSKKNMLLIIPTPCLEWSLNLASLGTFILLSGWRLNRLRLPPLL